MKKIVFGGIYIIAGLLFAIVLCIYGIIPRHHDAGYAIILSFISVLIGIIFTIKGLRED